MNRFDELAEKGWTYVPGWLVADEATRLHECASDLRSRGLFKRAGVGKSGESKVVDDVRKDEIHWLERELDPSIDALLARLEDLRLTLNREFFLGLRDFEAHFAVYPPGGHYSRHKDRFRADDARTISAVLYLNEEWTPEFGGELVIHKDGAHRIQPRLGTLALFRSDEIEHEVTSASRERWSIAIWFRR